MSFANGGRIVTDGLVLALDASDPNSYNPSENLLTYSNDFTNAVWTRGNTSITSSAAISPDGTQNATLIVQDTVNTRHTFRNSTYPSTISGNQYTLSFFVKPAGTTKLYVEYAWMGSQYSATYFDVSTKTKIAGGLTPSYVDYPNGWTRVIITGTASTSSTATTNQTYAYIGLLDAAGTLSYTGDGTSGAYFYGFQMESNSFVTDYKNTTSSPIFRNTWTDLSGNKNSGSLISNPTYSSSFSGGIVTSGSAYIQTPLYLPSPSTTPTTFEIIFKNNATNSSNYGLIGSSQYLQYGFAVAIPNPSLSNMRCTYNNSGSLSEFDVSYDSSVVSMCTYIFNGTVRSVYRNGVFLQSNTAGFSALASPYSIAIGNIGQGGYPIGQLSIYSVKIYNKALSSQEILQNYNASKSRFNLT
jgi:hypothetical protein